MMRGWFYSLSVLGFAVLFCFCSLSAAADYSADSSRVAALADSSDDWSGGISPDHDPDAPPREYDPGEAGLPSDASVSSQEAPEDTTMDEDPGEAGLPSDASVSSQEAPEDTIMDEDPGEAGLPSAPAFLNFSDYTALQSEDPGEAGLPSDASVSSQEAPEDTTMDEDPGEAGLPSDASESTQEATEEPATSTDLKTLDDVYTLLVVLLGSLWALAGLFFAFKLGGAFL